MKLTALWSIQYDNAGGLVAAGDSFDSDAVGAAAADVEQLLAIGAVTQSADTAEVVEETQTTEKVKKVKA